ncbi:TonB-dependent receptor [Flammeovirgaceae bacterium SG7u.111]|nr:TonB-dependent receptor [Flammeovirgaceae bacterium SG7u.132]WPO37920.1 TonB-dependent receptor [Flammeovirgaceae bacterium SG7u.111]
MRRFFILSLLGLLAFPLSGMAQNSVELTIVDGSDKSPLIGAHVCLLSASGKKSYFVADIDGKAVVPYTPNLTCAISYSGYKTTEILVENKKGQTVKMKPDLLMLDQVVKTASVEPQRVDESIYKIGLISSATIEKQGVQNLNDALRFQPNINLQQDGVLGSQIIMQGLEGQHVKILVDGIPLNGRLDGNIDLSQIDMSQVDHVEIVEGPMSVVYGSNALAGTINIITKDNSYYKLNGSATVYGESVGVLSGNATVAGIVGGKHHYNIGGGYRYFNGYDLDKSTRSMDWDPKNQTNLDASYTYKEKNWDLKVGTRLSQEDLTLKGGYVSELRAFDTEYITQRTTFYGQGNKRFENRSALNGMASFSVYDRTSQLYYVKEDQGGASNKSGGEGNDRFETWNARFSYALPLGEKFDWQIGYELNDEAGFGGKIAENDRLVEHALWSDIKIKLSDEWQLQPGLRYLNHNVFDAPLIYSGHLKWKPQTQWEGRVSFAKGFRTPSMKELYMNFVDTNHQIFGNPNLTPETSYSLNAALGKTISTSENAVWKLDATAFYNHLFDVIELAQGDDGIVFYYQNVSEKKTHGGTLSANFNNDNRLKASLGFTLTGIGYDPADNGQLDFEYAKDLVGMVSYFWPLADLNMQVDYKYTGERTQLYASGTDGEVTRGTASSYDMLNYAVTKGFKNKKYLLTGGVKNLLNVTGITNTTQGGAHSSTSDLMIAWGRSYYLSLKINLKRI